MATLNEITSSYWQLSTAQAGEVVQGLADIQQCIQTLLSTQRGSAVLMPTFGIDIMALIGQPINVVKADLTRDIIEQIEAFEPRVSIEQITATMQGDGSNLLVQLTWNSARGTGTNNVQYAISS
jgi:phage baseplate assembly protein W